MDVRTNESTAYENLLATGFSVCDVGDVALRSASQSMSSLVFKMVDFLQQYKSDQILHVQCHSA